jgi:transposase
MTFSNADLEAGLDRPRRRVFSVEYKLALLEEYYRLTEPGAKNALLRREGLYSSHVVDWRRARDAGTLVRVSDTPRRTGSGKPAKKPVDGSAGDQPPAGPPSARKASAGKSAAERENERLAAENARLAAELVRTKAALEVVGKAHALLELLSESADTDPTSHE